MGEMMRTHVLLPRELVERIDHEVGPRRRSAFVAEAVEEKLNRCRLLELAEEAFGSLADSDVPGWETAESTRAWVRAQRHGSELATATEG
jgi:metal-responsive CopG/Arc/MetJ family transcriptional regulator